MYNGSHAKANNKPRIRMNKLAILFIAVVMLIGAVVGLYRRLSGDQNSAGGEQVHLRQRLLHGQ